MPVLNGQNATAQSSSTLVSVQTHCSLKKCFSVFLVLQTPLPSTFLMLECLISHLIHFYEIEYRLAKIYVEGMSFVMFLLQYGQTASIKLWAPVPDTVRAPQMKMNFFQCGYLSDSLPPSSSVISSYKWYLKCNTPT
jgi:hypothetical protein